MKIFSLLKTYRLKLLNARFVKKSLKLQHSRNWCLFSTKLKIKKRKIYSNVLHMLKSKYSFFAKKIKSYYAINAYCPMAITTKKLKKSHLIKLFSIQMIYSRALSQWNNSKLNVKDNYKIFNLLRLQILIKSSNVLWTQRIFFFNLSFKISNLNLK